MLHPAHQSALFCSVLNSKLLGSVHYLREEGAAGKLELAHGTLHTPLFSQQDLHPSSLTDKSYPPLSP